MAKVVKTVAAVVGVAALVIATGGAAAFGIGIAAAASSVNVLGLSASTLFLASAGLSAAASLLAKRPKAPGTSDNAEDRLKVSIDPRTPRKFGLGRTALATDIRDQELNGNQEYLDRFIVVASHAVEAIEEIWFDEKLAWNSGTGILAEYAGYLTVAIRTEGSGANAINIGPRMGSARRYTGLAYVYLRYKLTGNSKKTTSPFQQAVPSRVTIVGKAAKVYDPRLDSTVPGGSGPQRANDQSTWAWNDSASRNPALQLLWYLLGWRINGKLAVGKGIPPARINLESFITAANLCDEPVTLAAGGTEPRYRSDGLFSEGDATATVIDQLKASMNADLDDVDGRLRLLVLHNDLATPIADFSEDDVLGEFTWDQTLPLDEQFNVVRGTYIDPSARSLYQAIDYPEVRIESPDGIDRIETVDLQTVQSANQAQRLAKQRVARMLYSGTFTATFGHRAWKVQRGDVVRLSFAPLGFTNKLFRVIDTAVQVDGQVPMTLKVEHPDIYLWDAEEAPAIAPVESTTYDPAKDPIYTFIADNSSLTGLLTNETHTLPATAAGAITSYAGASGEFLLFSGAEDVSALFSLSTAPGGNPQGLTVAYVDQSYSVTAGFDAAEPNAYLTIRATGSGAFAGVTVDKVFSLTKSLAGSDGVSPPLIVVTSTHQTFRYDAGNVPLAQTTTIKAARQNTAGATEWRLYKADGALVLDWRTAASMVSAGAADSSPDNDTLVLNQARFNAILNGNSTTGVIYETRIATSVAVQDRIGITKVQDGANGAPGADGVDGIDGADGKLVEFVWRRAPSIPATPTGNGIPAGWSDDPPTGTDPLWMSKAKQELDGTLVAGESWSTPVRHDGPPGADGANGAPGAPGASGSNGTDGFTIAPASAAFSIACASDGTPKLGEFNKVITFVLRQGSGPDLAGDAATSFSAPTIVGCTAALSGTRGQTLTISAISADSAYVDVVASRSGTPVATVRVTLTKAKDGVSPSPQYAAVQITDGITLHPDKIVLTAGQSITAEARYRTFGDTVAGTGNSLQVQIRPAGGAWSVMTNGSNTQNNGPGDPVTLGVSAATFTNVSGVTQSYELRTVISNLGGGTERPELSFLRPYA